MRPYGGDRVEPASNGGVVLISRGDKGWQGRKARTSTSTEHPGTAVLWDDMLFEVVSVQETELRFRYHLAPWREEHTVRVTQVYDAAHETARAADRADQRRRHEHRRAAMLLAPLTGCLPAAVQEHLGREYGILPVRLTMLSLTLPILYDAWLAYRIAGGIIDESQAGVPLALIFLGMFLFAEMMLRLFVVFSQSRPIGTALGFLVYSMFWLLHPRRGTLVHPFSKERGMAVYKAELSRETLVHDRYIGLEPLLTLLPAEDQRLLEARFAFRFRRHASTVAFVILCFAVAGVITSWNTIQHKPTFSARSSLLLAGIVAVEQVWRLIAFRTGPAGSMFGVLVRPFSRILFEPRGSLTRARDSHPDEPRGASE